MKSIILCAGYATRLYPYTINTPKCLLKYKDKAIIDYIIEDLIECNIDEIVIVTNNKFYNTILSYIKKYKYKITVINDNTNNDKEKLGAIGDLIYTLNNIEINDSYIIMASDNILSKSLYSFINSYNGKNIIMYYKEYDTNKIYKTGQVILENNKVIEFYEKSNKLFTTNVSPPYYIFNEETLNIIKESNIKADSLGLLIKYLINKVDIYGYLMDGDRIDMGSR